MTQIVVDIGSSSLYRYERHLGSATLEDVHEIPMWFYVRKPIDGGDQEFLMTCPLGPYADELIRRMIYRDDQYDEMERTLANAAMS